ncbi:MAG TPA: hypothetical protein VGE52_09415, partial [Pirellulales bacterium]
MSTTLRNFGASGAGGSSGRGDSRQPGDAEVWLSGDSIGCVCPKCGLDAGVRVGDAFAECTSCRVTWPLTEPQRQAARGLLAGFRRAQQAAAPAADSPPDAPATFNPFRSPNTSDSPHSSPDRAELGDAIEPPGAGSSISSATSGPAEATSGSGAVAEPIREKKRVVIVRKRRPAGAPVAVGPTGALAPVQPLPPRPTPYKAVSGDPVAAGTATPTAEAGQPADAKAANAQVAPPGERRRLVDLVDDVPGWLISLVVHLVLVIVLGLIYLPHEGNSNSFNLLGSLGEDSAEDPARGDRYDPADDFTETEEFSAPGELASAEPAELPSPVVPEPPAAASEAPVEAADVPVTFQPTLVRPAASEPAPAEESNPRRSRSSRSPRGGASGGAESDAPHAPGMPGLTGTPGGFDGRGSKMRGDLLEFYGGNEDSESAVAKGLRWLAKVQEPNGRWSLEKWGGASPSDTAATGLGLLPFLAAGQTHKEGEYQKTVYRALDWLKANQLTN